MIKKVAPHMVSSVLLFVATGCAAGPRVGDAAPDFVAQTDEGARFQLSQLESRHGVVLYFYGKNDAPEAAAQTCAFRDRMPEFEKQGYKIVGVSCDSIESHKVFKARHKLSFTLIADPKGQIARKFGVPLKSKKTGDEKILLADRQTFVIDKSGILKARLKIQNPEKNVQDALTYAMGH